MPKNLCNDNCRGRTREKNTACLQRGFTPSPFFYLELQFQQLPCNYSLYWSWPCWRQRLSLSAVGSSLHSVFVSINQLQCESSPGTYWNSCKFWSAFSVKLNFQKKQKLILHLNLKGWKMLPRFFNGKEMCNHSLLHTRLNWAFHRITDDSAIIFFAHQWPNESTYEGLITWGEKTIWPSHTHIYNLFLEL